ncbi:MAG: hypothetical protein RQ982_06960, partial [Gammaproteobacteria bacterium]|nr:hypothetical protein [Gammaproteobacteria bacterium]
MPNNSNPDHGHPEVSLKVTVNSNPNANGRNGLDGNNGYSYGERGTDGSRGGDGKDAANLNLTLSHHQNEKGRWVNIADAGVVHWSVQLDSQASISLWATGGSGGRGGRGGNGARGAPGADGIDATQYRLGTNGQRGGWGGDAGSGGRGGNGGDGGHIRIRLPESSPLLMLIDSVNVYGGIGGSGSGG